MIKVYGAHASGGRGCQWGMILFSGLFPAASGLISRFMKVKSFRILNFNSQNFNFIY